MKQFFKQFFKQFAVGVATIFVFAAIIWVLQWVSKFYLWIMGLINLEEATKNFGWILLGMFLTILISWVGNIVLYIINADVRQEKKRKKEARKHKKGKIKLFKRRQKDRFRKFREDNYNQYNGASTEDGASSENEEYEDEEHETDELQMAGT